MSLSIPFKVKENPELFSRRKVLIIGDIAFDRSYYCRPATKGFHAYHANEKIYDIEPGGDDFGAVGSANNVALFSNSFKADSFLLTVIGKDPEGRRVKEVLKKDKVKNRCIELKGVQTITRLRFFIYNEKISDYELSYRMDKEPDYDFSYSESLSYVRRNRKFRKLLESQIRSCNVLIINDTEKGFISEEFVKIVSEIIVQENKERKLNNYPEIVVLVDPKNDWGKFQSLSPGVILKPNLKETSKELKLDINDHDFTPENPDKLKEITSKLKEKYGSLFKQIVITLGRYGALYIRFDEASENIYRFSALHPVKDIPRSATHCGDVFSAALGLALTLENENIFSAIPFANWIGFLQYCKQNGQKVTLQDLLKEENLEFLQRNAGNKIQI